MATASPARPTSTVGELASVNYCIKEGWLSKRGHVVKSWKRRLFVLDGLSLAYYAKVGDNKPKGVIPLFNAAVLFDPDDLVTSPTVSTGVTSPSSVPFTFVIRSNAPAGRKKSSSSAHDTYIIAAANSGERSAWIEAIQYNIKAAAGDTSVLPSASSLPSTRHLGSKSGSGSALDLKPGRGNDSSPLLSPGIVEPDAGAAAPASASDASFAGGWTGAPWERGESTPGSRPESSFASITHDRSRSSFALDAKSRSSFAADAGRRTHFASFASTGGATVPGFSGELPSCIRLWSGSWNMAEAAPPAGMCQKLLPPGCDIYVLALQECMHTDAVFAGVRGFLGPDFLSVDHRIGGTMKGLGFHGHIALGVFVAEWLVASGMCKISRAVRGSVALGVNLVVTRVSNKGAVAIALPLRLPDPDGALSVPSSLVFISCHLASDNKGNSRIGERLKNAREVIEALGLELSQQAVARAAYQLQAAGIAFQSTTGSKAGDSALNAQGHQSSAAASAIISPSRLSALAFASLPLALSRDPGSLEVLSAEGASGRSRSRSMDAPLSKSLEPDGVTSSVHSLVQSEPATQGARPGAPRLSVARISAIRPSLDGRKRHHSIAEAGSRTGGSAASRVGVPSIMEHRSAFLGDTIHEEHAPAAEELEEEPESDNSVAEVGLSASTSSTPMLRLDSGSFELTGPGRLISHELKPVQDVGDRRLSLEQVADEMHHNSNVTPENPLGVHTSRSYVMVAGDLNFRVQLPFDECAKAIVAASTEVQRRIAVSGNLLGEDQNADSYVNADTSEKPWRKLLHSEQLRLALASGHVFPGFAEPPITFPPSYRIRKSHTPVLLRRRHDFCNLDKVKDGYSVSDPSDAQSPPPAGQEADRSELKRGEIDTDPLLSNNTAVKKVRTPSYTDRILMRTPVLAGVPVSAEDYRRELKARKDRRSSKGRPSTIAIRSSPPAADKPEQTAAVASAHFVPLPALRCLMYDTLDALVGSDHFPVVSVWELPLSLPDGASPAARSPVAPTVEGSTPYKVKARTVPVHTRALPDDMQGDAIDFPTYLPFPLVMPSALEVLGHLPPSSVSSALTFSSSTVERPPPTTNSDSSLADARVGTTSRSLGRVARFSDAESDGGEEEEAVPHIAASNHTSPVSSASSYASQLDGPVPPPPMVNTGGRIAATLKLAKMLPGDSLNPVDMHTRALLEAARQQMHALAIASSYGLAQQAPTIFDSSPEATQEVFYFQADREKPLMVPAPQFLFPAPPPTCKPPPPYTWPMHILQDAGVNLLDLPLDLLAEEMPPPAAVPPPPPIKWAHPPKPPARPAAAQMTVAQADGMPVGTLDAPGAAISASTNELSKSSLLAESAAPGTLDARRAVPALLVRQRTQEWNNRATQPDEPQRRYS